MRVYSVKKKVYKTSEIAVLLYHNSKEKNALFCYLAHYYYKGAAYKRASDHKTIGGNFQKNDVDGDGRLTKEELKKAFEQLGSRNPGWRVLRAFRHADNNKDGSISLEELDELVKYVVGLRISHQLV
ncbi:hypothetical protein Pint_08797 [Pistacia integerrima]|uniref:Uncharacterized protein n=1 Tax=Pistacia integerrima TaxID=434235 RepID=A0ACC0XVM4_9ROSI|nr:hypothetical protein Pint_08797 [Pistacia integerrima]